MQTSRPSSRRKALLISAAVIAAIVVSVLAVALATTTNHPAGQAGQSGQPTENDLPNAGTLLMQSADSTRALRTAHLDQTVTGTVPGLPIKAMNSDIQTTPAAASKGNAKLLFAGSEVDTDFVILDGELYITLNPGTWDDMGKAADLIRYDPSSILNPGTGLANLLSTVSAPKAVGRETIRGFQTVKIIGQVSADAVTKLFPQITANGPVPATAWIRQDGNHELVQLILEPSPGNSIQSTLSKWNEPVSVQKPV